MAQESSKNTRHIDVAYVAQLARMQLSDKEVPLFQDQLNHILHHVDTLMRLDVDDVEPTSHPFPGENVYRDDEPREGLAHEAAMKNAPKTRAGFYVVPKILE